MKEAVTRLAIVTAATALALAAPALARNSSSWTRIDGPKWVAINICDSSTHQLGIRASQPGDEADRRMFTRFRAEWYSREKQAWLPVEGSESPYIDAGPGRWLNRITGYTRAFAAPPAGTTFVLRGLVEMEWREGKVVHRAEVLTTPQTCEMR